jgi:flagellar motor switch protein FliG
MVQAKLKGREKAAMLLISLGPELSAQVLHELEDPEIERLTREIAGIRAVPAHVREEIFAECYGMIQAGQIQDIGGREYARILLNRALGERKAAEIFDRVSNADKVAPFEFMEEADPLQIAGFLKDEHPQTVAVVLSHLSAAQAAAVLSHLEESVLKEVATRIAKMERIAPDILKQVELGLQIKFSSVLSRDYEFSGGPDFLVKVLNQVDRGTEKAILEYLETDDRELADDIRGKMFVFDDIALLDNQSIQKVVQEVDRRDLAMALKGASEEVRALIFQNMSTRARELLSEEMEVMGSVRLSMVEESQRAVTEKIREMEAQELIFVARGQDEIIS